MLKLFRHKGFMKVVLWIVAIVIVIAFGFFGTANYMGSGSSQKRATYAGKIYGKKISFDKFDQVYQQTSLQLLLQYGDNFFKIKEFLNIPAQAWDRMILLEEVNRRNIKIPNEDVIKTIQEFSFFQRDDQFDTFLYNDIVKYSFKVQPRTFEENIRNSLKIQKLYDEETSHVTIPPDDVFQAYKLKNEKVQVSYILISPKNHQGREDFSQEEAENYYESNLNKFLTPPSIDVNYIHLEFTEDMSEEAKELLSNEAYEIFSTLQDAPDFNAAAKKHNVAIQSTGFFSQEEPTLKEGWSFELLQQAFKLEENQFAAPIQTEQGIYLITLKEKREAYIPEFEQTQEKVLKALQHEDAKIMAKTQAENYLSILKEKNINSTEKFADSAKSFGLEIHQTPVFNRGQYLPKVGLSKLFQEAAFALTEENQISEIVETDVGYCILNRDAYTPVSEEDFAKEKETIEETILSQKKEENFNEFLTKLRLQANLEDNVSKTDYYR